MISLVIYDIPNDRLRSKVADICLDYGLERIQFSAFLGELEHNRREELLLRLKRQVSGEEANVQLFPVCDKDIRLRKEIVTHGNSDQGQ